MGVMGGHIIPMLPIIPMPAAAGIFKSLGGLMQEKKNARRVLPSLE